MAGRTSGRPTGPNRQRQDESGWQGTITSGWMRKGHGQYVGVTMSVLQNQDIWWGEGDDMFFIDGAKSPSITGTGTEDYFLGAWDFGGKPFSYAALWRARRRQRAGGQPIQRLPLPSRFADSVLQILQGDHRAWPCQRPLGQLLFRRATGTRPSRMRHFRRCRPSKIDCPRCSQWVALEIPRPRTNSYCLITPRRTPSSSLLLFAALART